MTLMTSTLSLNLFHMVLGTHALPSVSNLLARRRTRLPWGTSRYLSALSFYALLLVEPIHQGVNKTCQCLESYSPTLDRQRFCKTCGVWFHEHCLEGRERSPSHEEQEEDDGDNDSWLKLLKVPYVRGYGGLEGEAMDNDWQVVGNMRKLRKVLHWKKKGTVPDNWIEVLGK
jgi:hypothetical protein